MRLTTKLSYIVLALSVFSHGRQKTLHREQTHLLNVKLGSNDWGLWDAECDTKGNTIVTVFNPAEEEPADRPLLMFDERGLLKSQFTSSRKALNLSSYEDHNEPSAPLPDGGIARLVWSNDSLWLVRFSAAGRFTSRTKLDPPAVFPSHIAVFPSGELLVTGLEHSHSRRALGPYRSFTSVYDQIGRLQKRLAIAGDIEIDAAAEIGDTRYAPRGPMSGNRAITSGKIRLGDDGNAYVMRHTSPATVYVISSSGEVLRTLMIEPASDGQMPVDMQVAGGRIALEFSLSCAGDICQGASFTIADAATGQKITDYADQDVSGAFSCYTAKPETFQFLRVNDDHKLVVFNAVAR